MGAWRYEIYYLSKEKVNIKKGHYKMNYLNHFRRCFVLWMINVKVAMKKLSLAQKLQMTWQQLISWK